MHSFSANQTRVIFSCTLLLIKKETFNLNKVLTKKKIFEKAQRERIKKPGSFSFFYVISFLSADLQ